MPETYEGNVANAGSGGARFPFQRYTISTVDYDFPVALQGLFIDETTAPICARGDATYGMDVDVTRLPALTMGAGAQADGHSVTLGATTDAAAAGDSSNVGLIALFKRLLGRVTTLLGQLPAALTAGGNLKVSLQESNAAQAVTGTFWQATQPVSVAATVSVDSELPAAAALADAAANFSAPAVGGANLVYNGATWDRLRGSTTNGAYADLRSLAGTAIAVNSGNKDGGTQRVVLATDQPALTTPVPSAPQATTTGGATPTQVLSAASTNAQSIKGSAGTLYSLTVINTTGTVYYLKFYDVAGTPNPASDTPKQTFPIPASTSGAGVAVPLPAVGLAFANGIGLAIVGGIGATDNTSAATGIAVSLGYK